MKLNKDAPLDFIWDILHERGYTPQGFAPENIPKDERFAFEKQAWDFAEEEIKKKYPMLEEWIEDFYRHRDDCLRAYL